MSTLDPTVALLTIIAILAIGIYKKLYIEASVALFFVHLLWGTMGHIPLVTTGYVPLETVTTFAPADSPTTWLIQWLSSPTISQLDVYAGLGIIIAIVLGIMWAFQMQKGDHWIQKILEKREHLALPTQVLKEKKTVSRKI